MKSFLKITALLALMGLLLLTAPLIVGHLCHGLVAGTVAFGFMVLVGVLLLGLAIVGSGTLALVALAVLIALTCALISALLPVALPVLLLAGFIALILKLVRRKAPVAA